MIKKLLLTLLLAGGLVGLSPAGAMAGPMEDFQGFLNANPGVAAELYQNPGLLQDQGWLDQHPDLESLLAAYPGVDFTSELAAQSPPYYGSTYANPYPSGYPYAYPQPGLSIGLGFGLGSPYYGGYYGGYPSYYGGYPGYYGNGFHHHFDGDRFQHNGFGNGNPGVITHGFNGGGFNSTHGFSGQGLNGSFNRPTFSAPSSSSGFSGGRSFNQGSGFSGGRSFNQGGFSGGHSFSGSSRSSGGSHSFGGRR